MKRIQDFRPSSRRPVNKCTVCGESTREGKSLCTKHIHLASYAQQVKEKQRLLDDELAGSSGSSGSLVIEQILNTLRIEDGLNLKELSRQSDVPFKVLPSYLKTLWESGLIDIIPEGKTKVVFLRSGDLRLTATQLAKYLGIHVTMIRRAVKRGAPHIPGKKIYFEPKKFVEWRRKEKEDLGQKFHQISLKAKKAKAEAKAAELGETGGIFLNTKQTAAAMGFSPDTIRFWVTKGLKNYKSSQNYSLFNLEEVKRWYAEFKAKDALRRTKTKVDWNEVYDIALEKGIDYVSETYNLNRNVIRRKLKEMDAPNIIPKGHRNMPVTDAAKILNVKPVTVFSWIYKFNAPHDRIKMAHRKRPRVLVDPEELREWYNAR